MGRRRWQPRCSLPSLQPPMIRSRSALSSSHGNRTTTTQPIASTRSRFRRTCGTRGPAGSTPSSQQHPANLWLSLAYGHVFRSRDPARAETLYRRSADGFQRTGQAEGEILARSNLRNFLFPKGRVEEATRETARVAELGRSVTDPLLKARAWTLEATHVQETGGDLSLAYRLLKQTEVKIFPDGPYRLKRTTLISLGGVAFRLGRLDEALTIFQKLDAPGRRRGRRTGSGQRAIQHPQYVVAQRVSSAVDGRTGAADAARRALVGHGRRRPESGRHAQDASRDRGADDERLGGAPSSARTCRKLPRARGETASAA